MNDGIMVLLGVFGGIGFLALVAFIIERKVKSSGPLFTQPSTRFTRILAFILALVFGGYELMYIVFNQIYHPLIVFIILLLVFYSLGWTKWLKELQERTKKKDSGEREKE